MLEPESRVAAESRSVLGEPHVLLEQMGSPAGSAAFCTFADLDGPPSIRNLEELRRFLVGYRDEVLGPGELPAIAAAWRHASGGELREMVAVDHHIAGTGLPAAFATASRRIGRRELRRLQPLRDERTVRRYFQAVERGEASGWHTIVFGLTLAIYSVPLRQGLLHYALKAVATLASSASRHLPLRTEDLDALLTVLLQPIPEAVARACADPGPGGGQVAAGQP